MESLPDILVETIAESWLLLGEMAPYLVFGFAIAGSLSVFMSTKLVERHLSGKGLWPVAKASLLGVPLPLCSCSVIPVSISIRQQGASRGATVAFLLSTPQTGVDSIAVTWGLLSPVFALFRAVAALVTGLLGGALVEAMVTETDSSGDLHPEVQGAQFPAKPLRERLGAGLRHALITLPRDIGTSVLIGILIAGLISVLVPAGSLGTYLGGGIVSILIMMGAGVPVYVCATASVPIAVGFMHAGASAGSAMAFLIAGPATNAVTITTVWKILGKRTALIYLLTVAASAIGFGLLLDLAVPADMLVLQPASNHLHEATWWYSNFAAILLLAMLILPHVERQKMDISEPASNVVEELIISVTGLTCKNCAATLGKRLEKCAGVLAVNVVVETGIVTVSGNDFDKVEILNASGQAGYPATEMK